MREREGGRGEGLREGQSHASHKFSAACGLRHAAGCELCPPNHTLDQLGLEEEEILNVELMQGRVVSTGSRAWRPLASSWVALVLRLVVSMSPFWLLAASDPFSVFCGS